MSMGSPEQQATQAKETFLIQTTTHVLSDAQGITNIPGELREKPQWVLWRGEDRTSQGTGEVKVSKVPIDPRTLKNASTTDPRTWGTFEDCCKALACACEEWGVESPDRGGLGFVLTANDPYTGIDLDHCRDPETGEIAPWAQHIVNAINSYTEVSPSGTGLHIFTRGRLSSDGRKRGDIELYDRGRYFTVTGEHLPGTPTTLEARQAVIEWLYTAMPILAQLFADSGKREKFQHLFIGGISDYGNDDSRADLALCSLAGHVRASAEQIDALMRLSGLMRPKWDEKHGSQTYGQMTIAKALERTDAPPKFAPALTTGDVVGLDTVEPVAVAWLWKPYLPLGKLASLEGDLGTGKSTLAATLAAHVTTGGLFREHSVILTSHR